MSIEGLGQYGGFYNQYKIPQIQQISVEDVKQQQAQLSEKQADEQSIDQLRSEYTPATPDNRSRMADLENISLSFNANETYDYIGADASLENLDTMTAISDMQKDKVLEQYQYFVQPQELTGSVTLANADGIVVQKE